MRRAAIKYAPSTPKPSTATYKGMHAHGCTRCQARYEDTCPSASVNALCGTCTGSGIWQVLHDNRLAKDCCRAHSRPASKHDLSTYRLSPGCPWFICTACARTHPYRNPLQGAS